MNAKVAYLNAAQSCEQCDTRAHCLTQHCSILGLDALSKVAKIKGPFCSGEHVFHAGKPSSSLYFVKEGIIKCERVTANGGYHVAGFYLPGELFGSEDLGSTHHCYDAIALDESWVCEIPNDRIASLFNSCPELHHAFLARISERIRYSEKILTDSFHLRAKYRLVNFLYDFYRRLEQRKKQVGQSIILPMTKVDMASHLGISPETLSRLLRELEDEQQIRNGIGKIELIDLGGLAQLCS